MGGISGVNGLSGAGYPAWPIQTSGIEGTLTAVPPAGNRQLDAATLLNDGLGPLSALGDQSLLAISSASIAASAESYVAANGPVLASNELIGLVLLLLTLQYMQSNDDQEKQGLMDLIMLLAQQQSPDNGSGLLIYSSSSVTMESVQITALSMDNAMGAYANGAADPQKASPATAGSGANLNAVA